MSYPVCEVISYKFMNSDSTLVMNFLYKNCIHIWLVIIYLWVPILEIIGFFVQAKKKLAFNMVVFWLASEYLVLCTRCLSLMLISGNTMFIGSCVWQYCASSSVRFTCTVTILFTSHSSTARSCRSFHSSVSAVVELFKFHLEYHACTQLWFWSCDELSL